MSEENEDKGTTFGQDDNIFGCSKTAKGLFDASDDEDKESSRAFAAAICGVKILLKMLMKKVHAFLVRELCMP